MPSPTGTDQGLLAPVGSMTAAGYSRIGAALRTCGCSRWRPGGWAGARLPRPGPAGGSRAPGTGGRAGSPGHKERERDRGHMMRIGACVIPNFLWNQSWRGVHCYECTVRHSVCSIAWSKVACIYILERSPWNLIWQKSKMQHYQPWLVDKHLVVVCFNSIELDLK